MDEVAPDHFERLAAALPSLSEQERETLVAALPVIARFCAQLVDGETPSTEIP